ncbi:CARDB domain-containing protein [Sorangium sp. So ce1389]|uniref:CARDB domain-containing protein n=1 Tax=Sorangium sp. So ce1389 TaxID=3133336 RepID=UPI003F5FB6DA
MMAMTVGCGRGGAPGDPEPLGVATEALRGDEPDLVISSVSGPPSAMPGAYFTTSVTVCNQGNSASYSARVEVSLSEDDVVTPSDPITGYALLGYLDAGQCVALGVHTAAAMPDGAYTLGAVVDAFDEVIELSETNNAAAGGDIGIGYGPDLIVSAVSGPPSAFPAGWFEASVTVCNQGTQPSYGAEIDLLLSSDGAITPADFSIGYGYVPYLNPGQCFSATIPASIYVPDGTYTLGATVDPSDWVLELIESNNTAAGGVIGIGNQPDLVVSSTSGPPSATPGDILDASVTVCNQGTQASYGTHVELRISADATVTTADFLAGGGPAPYLDPGQCATVTFPASAYVPDGAYHLGAIVDPFGWVPELIETNNAGSASPIGIGYRPDLIVSTASGPPSVLPGSSFDASVTVCNQGTIPGYSMVELRLSADAMITETDAHAGSAPTPYLDPGHCAAVTIHTTAYVPNGAYHLGAIVDPYGWQPELIETNNATAGDLIGVGHGSDLIASAVSGPPSLMPGSGFNASVTVCNQGTIPSYGVGVDLLLSSDGAITPSDIHAGSSYVPSLSPGQCTSVPVPATAYLPDGAYRLGAIVDPGDSLAELIETNNAAAGSALAVGFGPDLIVSTVSGPPSRNPGHNFDASVTICNQGTQPSHGGDIALHLSADATVTTADFHAGNGPAPYLGPGECATVTLPANAYAPDGAYHLGAIVDPYGWIPELIESNNAAAAGDLIAIGHGPDLVVSAVSGPPSATPGSPFDASITVCNQGTAPSYGASVEVVLSPDATITSADFIAGGAWLPSLDAGQCENLVVPAGAHVPVDTYTLGAIVDAPGSVPELLESNNATAGGELLVTF